MKNAILNIRFVKSQLHKAIALFESKFEKAPNDSSIYKEVRIHDSLNKIYSPLTNAVYFIRLIKRMDGRGQWSADGIQLEFSPPLFIVGSDFLIENSTKLTYEVAEFSLANFLKMSDLPSESILYLDLVNAELVSATVSFLVPFPSHAEAVNATEQLCDRADTLYILDWRPMNRNDRKHPIKGNHNDGFWIFGDFGYHLHFNAIGDSNLNHDQLFHEKPLIKLPSDHIEASKCYVKFDLILTPEWFEGKGDYYTLIFKDFSKNIGYEAQVMIERIFAMNKKFCKTIPPIEELSEYNSFIQSVLKSYFAGDNVLAMPKFAKSLDDQKFNDIRCMVLRDLRIDISVPWKLHRKILTRNIKKHLNFDRLYNIPGQCYEFVFSWHSAAKFLPELERLVK